MVAGSARLTARTIAALLSLVALAGCAEAPPTPVALDAPGRLFARAYTEVMEYYVEPRSARDVALPGLAHLTALDPALAVAGDGDAVVLREGGAVITRLPQSAEGDARGWAVTTATILRSAKASSPKLAALTDERMEQTVFAGLTGTLDRFSRYAGPAQAREEHAKRDGFEGIGIMLDEVQGQVRVGSVVPGSPAERAGIEPGDRVIEIDGIPTASLSKREMVRHLRGPAGRPVELALRRGTASETLRKSVPRAYLAVPTVIGGRAGGLAVLRISSFNQQTTASLRAEFARLRQRMDGALRGVILDLRGNPGGLLDQAISVADLFMDGGRIVSTRGRTSGSTEIFDASPGDIAAGLPMAVLINGGSASAAEIVAAALQDSGRAIVIGSSSFGKGTVQTQLRLPNDGELTLTSARLYTPSGYALNEHGVVPDLCTVGLPDRAGSVAALLQRRIAILFGAEPQRAALDDAGWNRLRDACPGDVVEHPGELKLATRILSDPMLLARLSHRDDASLTARAPGNP